MGAALPGKLDPVVEIIALAPLVEPDDDWGMFCPDVAPVGRGDGPVSYTCPTCHTALFEGVHQRQLFDLAVRCPCGAQSTCETRPSGRPLAGRPVLIPAGKYRLSSPLDLSAPVMMTGQTAIDGYVRETGARWGMPDGGEEDPSHQLDPASLEQLAADSVALLGDRYEKLLRSHRRGLASLTPPGIQHRLVELIDYAKTTAVAIAEHDDPDPLDIDGDLITELMTTVTLFHRWRFHPAWPALVASLTNPTEVQHSVMTLLVASYLVDSGNGVGIVENEQLQGRVPDLWAQPTVVERLDLEVKTPLALRGPRAQELQRSGAIQLIERLFNEAASSTRGQLNPTKSGILAIGGYHLGEREIETLGSAASEVLGRQRRSKPHVVGILLCEASYEYGVTGAGMSMTPIMKQRLVRHPGYAGGLTVRDGPDAQLGDLEGKRLNRADPVPQPNRAERRRLERQRRRNRTT